MLALAYFGFMFLLLCVYNACAVNHVRRLVESGDVEPGSPAASPVWILWADAAIVAAAVAGWWW